MNIVIDYLLHMLIYAVISLPFAIVWRKIRKKTYLKKGIETTKEHEILSVLFVMYMVALLSQTVIPKIELSGDEIRFFQSGYNEINLTVFKEIRLAIKLGGSFFLVNIIGNIVVFMPIALFVGLLYNKPSFFKCVLITTAVSVFVEACQIPQNRGTDIDDVILNTVGGIAGYVLFVIINKLFDQFGAKCKIVVGN